MRGGSAGDDARGRSGAAARLSFGGGGGSGGSGQRRTHGARVDGRGREQAEAARRRVEAPKAHSAVVAARGKDELVRVEVEAQNGAAVAALRAADATAGGVALDEEDALWGDIAALTSKLARMQVRVRGDSAAALPRSLLSLLSASLLLRVARRRRRPALRDRSRRSV